MTYVDGEFYMIHTDSARVRRGRQRRLARGAGLIRRPDRHVAPSWAGGLAFFAEGKLYPVDCTSAMTANGSPISMISVAAYDAYPKGPTLRCIR